MRTILTLTALLPLLAACATAAPAPNTGPEGTCDSVPPDSVGLFQPIFINPEAVGRALTREKNGVRARADEFGRSTNEDEAQFRLLVDERGRVADVKVETSTGEPEMDRAIQRAFRLSRFRPGTLNCEATRMWITWGVEPSRYRGPGPYRASPARRLRVPTSRNP